MGIPREAKVGKGTITVMDAKELCQAMKQIYAEDPFILLHKSGCSACARIRAKLRRD